MADKMIWRRASECDNSGICVEIHHTLNGAVLMRNSDYPADVMHFPKKNWDTFIAAIKAGDFDLP